MKNKFKQIEERLAKIAEEMKDPELSIDELMAKAKKAYELIEEGKAYLNEAQSKIEQWSQAND